MLVKKCLFIGIVTLLSLSVTISAQPVHPTTGEPLVIDCLRGTVTVDGDLSDWNLEAMTPAVNDAAEQIYSGQDSWTGPEDLSGELYLLWDDVKIYIAAVVKDDTLSMNKTGGSIWNADCVEVFFSTTEARADHSWSNPTIHYQYGFNANNQKFNWCNMDGPGQSEPDYLQIASSVTADGYILEASIEYAQMLSLDFSAGNTIGFHPSIDDTDIDNGDTEVFMTWTGLAPHDQSLGYGHVVLSADSVPEPEDPNPVGWWPLSDGSGDIAVDVSGRGNDGVINNADTGGLGDGGSVWVEDPDRGTVISFNGTASGAFVRAGSIPQMTLTNNFTWSFWAKHSDENTADNDIILGNRMDENAVDFVPRQFIKFTPTKFEWHMNGNGNDNLEYDDIPADIWLHHVVVKAADQLTYYRNGVEHSSGVFTQPLDVPQPLFFGGDNEGSAGENWSGLMSDVRIYNRALTELEVMAIVKGVEQIDMKVGFAAYPPVIDGEVDGIWDVASTQNFVPLDDPANASGSWKVLYDMENLYVLLDVTDDSLQNDSSNTWQDDSVEIYFDGGNTKLSTPLSGDDHQYTFGWTTEEISGNNFEGYIDGMEHAQVDTDTGWRIEVKMPWLSIQGAEPQAGDLIGIDCYYNDDDDGGDSRENKLLSFSAVEGWNDASQWGTAVLAADKRIDVTAPGDVVQGVPNDGDWPGAETPDLAIDDDTATKYLHFKGDFDPDPGTGGTGFQVTPSIGGSIVTGLTLTTANDVPGRDPIAFELSGSNDSIDGPFTLIASGDIVDFAQEAEWPRFTMNATPIAFENDVAYQHYQLIFTAIRGPVGGSVNSMQIAEVELLGIPAEVESINLLANGSFEEDEPILDDPDWVQWCTWNPAEGAGSNVTIVDTDAADGTKSLRIEPVGAENWYFILVNISFAADLNKNYTASFWAKAEAPRPLTVQMKASDNSVNAWNATTFDLTTEWAEYSYTSEVLHTDVKLEFLCAGSEVPFLLDLVSVYEAE